MSAHTRGPWKAADKPNAHGRYPIEPTIGCSYGDHDEGRANAVLMAAAPELLEALEDTAEQLEFLQARRGGPCESASVHADAHAGDGVFTTLQAARAAIAKARGAA